MGIEFKGLGKHNIRPFGNDKNPSVVFNRSADGKIILFYDHGNTDYEGSVFDFAGYYYNKDPKSQFAELLEAINGDFSLGLDETFKLDKSLHNYKPKKQTIDNLEVKKYEWQDGDKLTISYKPIKDLTETPYADSYKSGLITFNELVELLISPHLLVFAELKDGYRKKDNFIRTNLLTLDFDGIALCNFDELLATLHLDKSCILAYETKRSRLYYDDDGELIVRLRAIFNPSTIFTDYNKAQTYLEALFDKYRLKGYNPDPQAKEVTHSFHTGIGGIYNMITGTNIRITNGNRYSYK
jgi:hypothetical protein